jgi:hypothetical protein
VGAIGAVDNLRLRAGLHDGDAGIHGSRIVLHGDCVVVLVGNLVAQRLLIVDMEMNAHVLSHAMMINDKEFEFPTTVRSQGSPATICEECEPISNVSVVRPSVSPFRALKLTTECSMLCVRTV